LSSKETHVLEKEKVAQVSGGLEEQAIKGSEEQGVKLIIGGRGREKKIVLRREKKNGGEK